jgi:hypothetical protein
MIRCGRSHRHDLARRCAVAVLVDFVENVLRLSLSIRSARNIFSNDWYGTSHLLASAFNSASNAAGSRKEMVSVDGLRLGNVATRAARQSTNGLVSWVSQKVRSLASERKAGTALRRDDRLGITFPLYTAHRTRRDHSEQWVSDRENDRQKPIQVCAAKRKPTRFRALSGIYNDHRPIQKDLFGFRLAHLVARPILRRVGIVPLEGLDIREEFREERHRSVYVYRIQHSM